MWLHFIRSKIALDVKATYRSKRVGEVKNNGICEARSRIKQMMCWWQTCSKLLLWTGSLFQEPPFNLEACLIKLNGKKTSMEFWSLDIVGAGSLCGACMLRDVFDQGRVVDLFKDTVCRYFLNLLLQVDGLLASTWKWRGGLVMTAGGRSSTLDWIFIDQFHLMSNIPTYSIR